VPDLVGLSTADARTAADEAGFADVEATGDERGVFEFYDQCEVIEQRPEAGATHPLSDAVEVTYSYSGDASECES
jgi:beta-lactam-binding protein with PASTA domain